MEYYMVLFDRVSALLVRFDAPNRCVQSEQNGLDSRVVNQLVCLLAVGPGLFRRTFRFESLTGSNVKFNRHRYPAIVAQQGLDLTDSTVAFTHFFLRPSSTAESQCQDSLFKFGGRR